MKGVSRSEGFYTVGVQLFAVSLGRIGKHAESGGMIVFVYRYRRSEEENRRMHKTLKDAVRVAGLGFFELDGYWTENAGKPEEVKVEERSLFVPFRAEVMTYDLFVDFARELVEIYGQEAALIVRPKALGWGTFLISAGGTTQIGSGEVTLDSISDNYSRITKGSHQGRPFFFKGVRMPSNQLSALALKAEGCMW